MKNISIRKILNNLEEIIASFFIVVTTVLVVANVFLRYVINTGIYWSEEVATICFVWSVFIGAAGAYKRKRHIGVDILVKKLPVKIRNVVVVIVDLILIVLNGGITYLSIVYVSKSYIKPTPVLGISSAYVSMALVIAFAIMMVYSVIFTVKDIQKMTQLHEGMNPKVDL